MYLFFLHKGVTNMTDTTTMRTWAEIDLNALEHNYKALKALLDKDCKLLAPVKADAYGHGAVPVSRRLEALGCDVLAVACAAEARELRNGGITAPVLCLGNTLPEYAHLLWKYDIQQAVGDIETARALSALAVEDGAVLSIHIKLDTGMSRLGFFWSAEGDNAAVLEQLCELFTLPGLKVVGMLTHFSDADGSEEYTMAQFTRFLDARKALEERGHPITLCSCAASAAVINFPCTHLDMVRPGIALYGYYPDESLDGLVEDGLRPVMTVKSRIAAVRALPAGTCVSYGRTATLERDSKLAVIPMGYGDGLPRQLSNRTHFLIHGRPCPIVGRVCMDMCMVDVTDLPEVRPGDVATVYDGELALRAAKLTGTIVYELLCDVAPRVPRVYLNV